MKLLKSLKRLNKSPWCLCFGSMIALSASNFSMIEIINNSYIESQIFHISRVITKPCLKTKYKSIWFARHLFFLSLFSFNRLFYMTWLGNSSKKHKDIKNRGKFWSFQKNQNRHNSVFAFSSLIIDCLLMKFQDNSATKKQSYGTEDPSVKSIALFQKPCGQGCLDMRLDPSFVPVWYGLTPPCGCR